MAFGDPAITTTLAHLPEARLNLAAVGVAKSLAVFFESPIIMLLHASNALAPSTRSRRALFRLTLIAMVVLSALLIALALPPVFRIFSRYVLGIDETLASRAGAVLLVLGLWPAAIAWRRYFQGLLIRHGRGAAVGRAGIGRLIVVILFLAVGYRSGLAGTWLAALALVGGVVAEAVLVTVFAWTNAVPHTRDTAEASALPSDLPAVWKFYWPLANSMLVLWGGRALLLAVIARAVDGTLALAVWPAAWGIVLLVGNATRMVQQVVIRNRGAAPDAVLLRFAISVGLACAVLLVLLATTAPGQWAIHAFIGGDTVLFRGMLPVLLICAPLPVLIALQNATQGLHIGEGRTSRVHYATWLGVATLLGVGAVGTAAALPGATAAALAMLFALLLETVWLFRGLDFFSTAKAVSV